MLYSQNENAVILQGLWSVLRPGTITDPVFDMSVFSENGYGKGESIMSKRDFDLKKSTNIEKMLDRISFKKKAPVELFILIVVLYVAASVIVSFTANSVNFIYIGESRLPVSAFAGVITSLVVRQFPLSLGKSFTSIYCI